MRRRGYRLPETTTAPEGAVVDACQTRRSNQKRSSSSVSNLPS
ncbi:hypothetical protein [Lysobacter gummosus]